MVNEFIVPFISLHISFILLSLKFIVILLLNVSFIIICILEIKHDTEKDIDLINHELQKQLGKKYDNLFDISDESRVSCVEVVYHSLKKFDFDKDYPNLAKTITEKNTLTPQMFRDCGDFKILFEK